jgi:hypothetical protein
LCNIIIDILNDYITNNNNTTKEQIHINVNIILKLLHTITTRLPIGSHLTVTLLKILLQIVDNEIVENICNYNTYKLTQTGSSNSNNNNGFTIHYQYTMIIINIFNEIMSKKYIPINNNNNNNNNNSNVEVKVYILIYNY